MEDNDLNEILEKNGFEERVLYGRSSRDGDDHSDTSSKQRYHSGRKTVRKITTYESAVTSQSGYNLRGLRGRSETPDVDQKGVEQTRTRRRTVVNGASSDRHGRTESAQSVNTSDYSSDEGLTGTAFPLYKQAGDWWDAFPKTDYTYSPVSPNRKEIAPGIIPMPNMSRRSIHSNSSSSEYTHSWFDNTYSESFARRSTTTPLGATADVHYTKRWSAVSSVRSFLTRIFTSIWMYLVHVASSVRNVFRRDGGHSRSQYLYYDLDSDVDDGAYSSRSSVQFPSLYSARRVGTHQSHSMLQKLATAHYWTECNSWLLKLFSRGSERRSRMWYLLLLVPPLILAGWWLLSSDNVAVKTSQVESTWWLLPLSLQNLWASEKMVVGGGSPGHEHTVDVELLVQKIIANEQFQQLVKGDEQRILAALQMHKELAQKEDMLNRHDQLTEDMTLMRQQMEELHSTELKKMEDRIRLLEEDMLSRQDQLTEDMTLMRQQMEELHNNVVHTELKKMEDRIRLLEVSHSSQPCCKVTPPPLPTVAIEQHVIKFLSGLFNTEGEAENKVPGLHSWLERLFVAKEDLESKLANITSTINMEVGEASQRSAQAIMDMVSDQIRQEYMKQQVEKKNWVVPMASLSDNCSLTVSQVQEIVRNALDTYDADKTGMVDYALESSGGSIINTRCTDTYNARTATLSLLGVPLWWPSSNPRTVIQPGVNPGECWAFRGAQGYLVIRLSGRVKISAFSMEHIPLSLAPNGRIDSAPKEFSVWGLRNESDKDPEMLGRYMYRDNTTSLQIFGVQRTDLPPFEIVELRIESNHGNLEYTCLYRFRVHGVLSKQ